MLVEMVSTPQTDELIDATNKSHVLEGRDDAGHYFALVGVLANHARALERQLSATKAEAAVLRQAVGLMTTLKGDLVMDVEHPLEMMQAVHKHVSDVAAALRERVEGLERKAEVARDIIKLAWFERAEDWLKEMENL